MKTKKIKCRACLEKKDSTMFVLDNKNKSPWEICIPCKEQGKKRIQKTYPKKPATPESKERDYKRMIQRHMKKTYGITLEDYNLMLERQNGRCAICNGQEIFRGKGKIHNLSVDHCHASGKVRGLLCRNCNQVIGTFKEDIQRFKNAIKYLNKQTKES